jgi:hypothetical protein
VLEDAHHRRDRFAAQVRECPYYRVVDLGDQRARLMDRERDLE